MITPTNGSAAIAGLPVRDSYRYLRYNVHSTNRNRIRKHCTRAHREGAPRGPRPKRTTAQNGPATQGRAEGPPLPYRPAKLQTLWTEKKQIQYFEVHLPGCGPAPTTDLDVIRDSGEEERSADGAGGTEDARRKRAVGVGASTSSWDAVVGKYRAAQRLRETGRCTAIEEATHVSEITPWLKATGFAAHLASVEIAELPSSYRLPDTKRQQPNGEEGETPLAGIGDSVERVLRKAEAGVPGHALVQQSQRQAQPLCA